MKKEAEEKRAAAEARKLERLAAEEARKQKREAETQAAARARELEREATRLAFEEERKQREDALKREADKKRADAEAAALGRNLEAERIAAEFASFEAKQREAGRLAAEEMKRRREAESPLKNNFEKSDIKEGSTLPIGFFRFGDTKPGFVVEELIKAKPKGVPVLSKWKLNKDGTITGVLSNSIVYPDGQIVTTSMINSDVADNTVVTTESGSRYYLVESTVKEFRNQLKGVGTSSIGDSESNNRDDADSQRYNAEEKRMKAQSAAKESIEKAKPGATLRLGTNSISENTVEKPASSGTMPISEIEVERLKAQFAAEQSIARAKPGATIGLFKTTEATNPGFVDEELIKAKPKGVPVLSKWKLNKDGTITGVLSNSIVYPDGQIVTTSMINSDVADNTVVTTESGSRYYLVESTVKEFRNQLKGVGTSSIGDSESNNRDDADSQRYNAEEKRMKAQSAAKESIEKAKPGATLRLFKFGAKSRDPLDDDEPDEVENKPKNNTAKPGNTRRLFNFGGKAREFSDDVVQGQVGNNSKIDTSDVEQSMDTAKPGATLRLFNFGAKARESSGIVEQDQLENNTIESKALDQRVNGQAFAKENIASAKPSATLGLFNFGPNKSKESSNSIETEQVKKGPKGVPILSKWKLNSNGTVTGVLSGSIIYPDGQVVTTSVIDGEVQDDTVVSTSSGSRYYLTDPAPTGFQNLFK